MGGTILELYIVDDASIKYSGGTRLYVGTTLGMTRIEAYDKESSPGYSAGLDNLGLSVNYGIVGSGARYEILGGTLPAVSKISSDATENIVFVITSDGVGNGGLTQISLSGNKKLIYMTAENGLLPSNDLRDVFGKG